MQLSYLLVLALPALVQASCGGGSIDNGQCDDSSLCCSQWGWCGSTSDYCGSNCQGGPCYSNYCGNGQFGNNQCADSNLCCSQWGWCGSSSDYCGTGCRGGPCYSSGGGNNNGPITFSQFSCIFSNLDSTTATNRYNALNTAISGTTLASSNLELAAFLAQIGHESASLTALVEYCALPGADPSCLTTYDGPAWCGAATPAGAHYYGRGFIQLTWSCNYQSAGNALGIDLLDNPDIVANDLTVAWQTAVWFWTASSCSSPARSGYFGDVTKIINDIECNGGNTGAQSDRVSRYQQALQCLSLTQPSGGNLYC